MYPFIFDSIKDPGDSCLLGVDFSGGVILFNQFLYKLRKEITKDEFVQILLENNFKEFPINTKKKNNILKKIFVAKEK